MTDIKPLESGWAWIDELSDAQCMEIFWLYVDPPEPFLQRHAPELLGQALRRALRQVLTDSQVPPSSPTSTRANA